MRRADDDVPSPFDLRNALVATTWAYESDLVRPYRMDVRARIAERLASGHGAQRILELGCGPGYLAEAILEELPFAAYTLLDFSAPFLAMARRRVGSFPFTEFMLADFLDPAWNEGMGVFDAIVTQQAVHELRHKRRAPTLYAQAREVLAPGGELIVCDGDPVGDKPLGATVAEQQAALASAGFADIDVVTKIDRLYVLSARHR